MDGGEVGKEDQKHALMKILESEPSWGDVLTDMAGSFVDTIGWHGYLILSLVSAAVGISIQLTNYGFLIPPEIWMAFCMWYSGANITISMYEFNASH